jgi:hypothetical protein
MSLEHVYLELEGLDRGGQPSPAEAAEQEKTAEEIAEETVKLATDYDTAGRQLAHAYFGNYMKKQGAAMPFMGKETPEEEAAEKREEKEEGGEKKEEKKESKKEEAKERLAALQEKKAAILARAEEDPEFKAKLLNWHAGQ